MQVFWNLGPDWLYALIVQPITAHEQQVYMKTTVVDTIPMYVIIKPRNKSADGI